jgi:hypothetical protein
MANRLRTGKRRWALFPAAFILILGLGPPGPAERADTDSSGGSPSPSAGILRDTLWVGRVSPPTPLDSLFSDWSPLAFGGDRGETVYSGRILGGRQCLWAEASAGGSGLLKLTPISPDSLPIIRWAWWIPEPVPGGDLRQKEGDDFAARIYVNFRFEPSKAGPLHRLRQRLANRRFGGEAPGKALVYVWGNQASAGTVAKSAYTDQAALLVVRSGTEGTGAWWEETRNLQEDYLAAFGEEPPQLHSVAIMTDADDTGTRASACYGDVVLLPAAGG